MAFSTIEEAIAAIAQKKIVIVVDDEDRENEGDLVMAAEAATPENIAFFLAHTSGVICVPLEPERADELDLPLMVVANTEAQRTAFTVSVDYRHGTSTGISSSDRATTIQALIDPATRPTDLNRPGHIFPLRYRPGGVLKRAGHTEATVDLSRLAGLAPAGVLCEVVTADKSGMARVEELEAFALKHDMPMISIADLIRYRRRHEKLVRKVAEAVIPTGAGDFDAVVYESVLDGEQHMAFVVGDIAATENVLVRVHSECLTGDVFGSLRCDCGPQLTAALERIAQEGTGVLVYLRGHEGRGIGLGHKIRAYKLQSEGWDTYDADEVLGFGLDQRHFGFAAEMLKQLGVSRVAIMTNNPLKIAALESAGLEVVEDLRVNGRPTRENVLYLASKRDRAGHFIDLEELVAHTPIRD